MAEHMKACLEEVATQIDDMDQKTLMMRLFTGLSDSLPALECQKDQEVQLKQHSIKLKELGAAIHDLQLRPFFDGFGMVSSNGLFYENILVMNNIKDTLTARDVSKMLKLSLEKAKSYVKISGIELRPQAEGKQKAIVRIAAGTRGVFFRSIAMITQQLECYVSDFLTRAGMDRRKQQDHAYRECKDSGLYPVWRNGAELYVRPPGADGKPGRPERYQATSYGDDSGSDGGSVRDGGDHMQSTPTRERSPGTQAGGSNGQQRPQQQQRMSPSPPRQETPPPRQETQPPPRQGTPPPPPARDEERGRTLTPSWSAQKEDKKPRYGVQYSAAQAHTSRDPARDSLRDPRPTTTTYAAAARQPASPPSQHPPRGDWSSAGRGEQGGRGSANGRGFTGRPGPAASGSVAAGSAAVSAAAAGSRAAGAGAEGGRDDGSAHASQRGSGALPKSPPKAQQ